MNKFKRWLKRTKSEATINSYVYTVEKFLEWVGGKDLNARMVDDYIYELEDNGNGNRSIVRHIAAIRCYFKFLDREDELGKIVVPRFKTKEPDFISIEEVKLLIKACVTTRDRAMIMLLYDSAIRVGELVTIERVSVDLEKLEIKVRTLKSRDGKEFDVIPISAKTAEAIRDHLQHSVPDSPWLFTGRGDHMKTGTVRARLETLSTKAGIKHVYPHMLRHSRATHIFQTEGGEALPHVSKLLRHSNIQTTMIYIHIKASDLRKNIPDAFPDEEE